MTDTGGPRHLAGSSARTSARYSADRTQFQAVFGTPDDSPIVVPGVAAMLRRHPRRVKAGAVSAMVGGVLLFTVASVAATAGADPAPHAPRPTAVSGAPVITYAPNVDVVTPAPAVTTPPVRKVPRNQQAPTDPNAISGLAANGIPSVALNAYRVAAARLANADPGCGIDWALLAGIGREESDHGLFGGAVLHADGISTPRIIGIPLDGHGTALIYDTDHGALDGDTVYDRAVGPMQFIPSTWAMYGTDADGDGVANPFDINDAALTSARYLCAAGGDLSTHDGQVRAVLAYNDSDQYLAQVLALADAYRRGIAVTGIPVGNTSGSLPALNSGALPPANPGAPTANRSGGSAPAPHAAAPKKSAPKPTPTSSTSTSTSSTGTGTGSGTGSGGGLLGGGGGSTSQPAPSPTPTSGSPSPSPTKKCVLWDLLNPGKCAIYG